jgi:hypothetical protein
MRRPFTFGIVGAYGASGRIVASELRRSAAGEILIGGRDLTKGTAVAAQFENRVSAAQLDLLDDPSLNDFCRRCSILVNCAGPVMALKDRVAQAALRNRCHYIDAAGMSVVKERLLPHTQEIDAARLSFVISAGWNPGLSELLPVYAVAQARTKMDTIESLSAYQADSGEWSTNALLDAVSYVHRSGLQPPGYFRKGKWTRVKMSESSRKVDLGDPVGRGRFALYSTPELSEVGRRLNDGDVFTYSYVSGLKTVAALMLMATVPLPDAFGVHLFRNVFRRNRLPQANNVGGFIVAQVVGHSQRRRLRFTAQIVFRDRQDYWIHGVTLATVARMVSEGNKVRAGVHFLSDVVDPLAFMAELRKAGVEQTENIQPCE